MRKCENVSMDAGNQPIGGTHEMTDEEIRRVFEDMRLPTTGPVTPVRQETEPVILFRLTGDSLPMNSD
jgi:hypothetical protein